ncbi:MAG: glycoside hydrolase family 15 protein [Anaerolineaceae bacterium]|nr:glycoside hydrolase family 15 protein [Anaerolineaceae bacterium]
MNDKLIRYSIDVILKFQQPNGAYPACPTMPDYQFCWFRDSSFIAHAMLISGETASAQAFHTWAALTILRYESNARRAMGDFSVGKAPNPHDILRARYTYDGGKGPDEWPEFQLDGLGTWLWALKAFNDADNPLNVDVQRAAHFVADYLTVLWPSPCHDLWEEAGDRVHTYTLAAIYGGLLAAADYLKRPELCTVADNIKTYVMNNMVSSGRFMKSVGNPIVDASLLGLATPYRLVEPDDPLMTATVKQIEADIYAAGFGVHRYRGDVYYGGGAWLLLLAWLGWYDTETGNTERAEKILSDIERQAASNGDLPEQVVPPMLADVSHYDYWVKVRGTIATPLLWSHAMQLITANAVQQSTVKS